MEPFNFGRTLSRAFALMRDSLASVGVFVLLVQLVSVGINFVTQEQLVASMTNSAGTADPGNAGLAIFGSLWYWGSILSSVLISALLYAGSIDGMLRVARGEQASLGNCLQAGAANLLPVLGLTILWWLGVGLGWILLIIPGLILITMWSAAMPALIGEKLGIIESFGRSRALTKGSRLTIFALLFVAFIVAYVPIMLIGGGAVFSGAAGAVARINEMGAMFFLLTIPFGWFIGMLFSALLVSIYIETTAIKGGGSTAHLTDVFV